jgi:hypothetical protein
MSGKNIKAVMRHISEKFNLVLLKLDFEVTKINSLRLGPL